MPRHIFRTAIARDLRSTASTAEYRLWGILRKRQMRGLKFRRQHPIGPYVADLACPELRFLIEVDGDFHGNQAARDKDRTRHLASLGWHVERIPGVVLQDRDMDWIWLRVDQMISERKRAVAKNSASTSQPCSPISSSSPPACGRRMVRGALAPRG